MRYSKKIFKAYDVRGKYPKEINTSVVTVIVQALVVYATSLNKNKKVKKRVIVGHDNRLSSPELYKAPVTALRQNKNVIDVHEGGLMTTPMMYFLVNHRSAVLGIIITASHNPTEYNGLKAVGLGAEPFSGEKIHNLLVKKSALIHV